MADNVTRFLERLFSDEDGIMHATTGSMEFFTESEFGPQTQQILGFMRNAWGSNNPLSYNEFQGDKVAAYLETMLGKEIIKMDFGREYSPVLYLTLRNQTNDPDLAKYAGDEKKLVKIIKDLKRLGADELSVEQGWLKSCHDGKYAAGKSGPGQWIIRAWWD